MTPSLWRSELDDNKKKASPGKTGDAFLHFFRLHDSTMLQLFLSQSIKKQS